MPDLIASNYIYSFAVKKSRIPCDETGDKGRSPKYILSKSKIN